MCFKRINSIFFINSKFQIPGSKFQEEIKVNIGFIEKNILEEEFDGL